MKFKLLPILLCIAFLTGCWDQKIYERVGFFLNIGIESGTHNEYLITYTLPVIGGTHEHQVEIISVESSMFRFSREKSSLQSAQRLEGGKMQQVLFSEDIAKKGIHNLLEIFHRNPANPLLAYVVVVEGSPKELLNKAAKFEDKPWLAFYITRLLDGAERESYIPETRVYNYDIAFFAHGLDPIAPMIKLGPEAVEVTGTALFHGDRMVGKLDVVDTSILLAMMGRLKSSEYHYAVKHSKPVQTDPTTGFNMILRSRKRRLKMDIVNDLPALSLDLELMGSLDEYQWDNVDRQEKQKMLEDLISQDIQKRCVNILEYLKSISADPIGLGNMIRAQHNGYWKENDWLEVYPRMDISVKVSVTMVEFGDVR